VLGAPIISITERTPALFGVNNREQFHGDGTKVLVTATRGERGTCGTPPLCSIEELPHVREGELRAAARMAAFNRLNS
jgi:hypothetical protein